MDTNGDGVLSFAESFAGMNSTGRDHIRNRREAYSELADLDVNGNGSIEPGEYDSFLI